MGVRPDAGLSLVPGGPDGERVKFLGPGLDRVFLHRVRRRVSKDRTVTVNGTLYEVGAELAGRIVTLLLDAARAGSRRGRPSRSP